MTTYPTEPGWKGRSTSHDAASGIAPRARSLRAQVYDALKQAPGSPEQIAERLGVPVMNVRPRAAELSRMGLITDSGQRATAMGGRKAIVWKAVSNVDA